MLQKAAPEIDDNDYNYFRKEYEIILNKLCPVPSVD